MCTRIAKQVRGDPKNNIVYFRKALKSCTIDTITHFCFANPIGALDVAGFESPIQEAMEAAVPTINVFKHFDLIHKLVTACPHWILTTLAPEMKAYLAMRKVRVARDVIHRGVN